MESNLRRAAVTPFSHNSDMTWFEITWGLFTIIASTSGSWYIAKSTVRGTRASNASVSAIEKLLPAVASLRALLHESTARTVRSIEVTSAVEEFESLCLQNDAALPTGLRSVRRQVRAAVGNYFGGPSLAALDARFGDLPLSDPEPYWQDVSRSYVEYIMAQLQVSIVRPRRSRIIRFDEWRRDEDQLHRPRVAPAAGCTCP
jgi:hypothetical protein